MGEQALDKVAEAGISSQLDEVEDVHVDIRTNPLKVMQGEVDSVDIDGKGMVMQKDLRVQEMKMHTDNVGVNPMSVAFGKIELNHATDADTRVVLTEQDINRAFNSDFIGDKLKNLDVQVQGEPKTIDTQRVEFHLPGEGKIALSADVQLRETQETKRVSFNAVPRIGDGGQRVVLENVQYTEGEGLSPELTDALLEKASELLDLRNFELEGMALRFKGLEAQSGQLTLQAQAHIEQFPSE
jgi:hypothetical protein